MATSNKRTTFDIFSFIQKELKKLSRPETVTFEKSDLSFWIQAPDFFQFFISLKTKGARPTSPSLKGIHCKVVAPASKLADYIFLFNKIERQIPVLVETLQNRVQEITGHPTNIRFFQDKYVYKLVLKVFVEEADPLRNLSRHSLKTNYFPSNLDSYELEICYRDNKQAAIDCLLDLTEPYFKFE